jgi:hypothetical protein
MPETPAVIARPDKLRAALLAAVLVALALALSACGGSDKGAGGTDPATIVPDEASAYVAVNVHPSGDSTGKTRDLSTALLGTATPGQALLDALTGQAEALGTLDYKTDVAPWLGDRVALAAVPVSDSETRPLLVAATKDEGKAQAALTKSGKLSVKASAAGKQYVKTADGKLAGAVVDGTVVVGAADVVEMTLAAVKDGETLSELQRYRNAIAALPEEGVATAYADLDALAKTLSQIIGGSTAGLLQTLLTGQGDAIAATVIPESGQLRIEAVGTATGKGIAATQAKGGASDAITTLPADSSLALGVSDVGQTLKLLLQKLGSQGGLTAIGLNLVLSRLEDSTGLNLERDVLGWMGPGGLFIRSANGHTGGALVVKSRDPAAMRRAVSRLRTALGQIQLPGVPAVAPLRAPGVDEGMALEFGAAKIQVAAAGDQLVIAIGPGALAAALHPHATLGENPKFQAAAARLGGGLKPGLYVDFQQLGGLASSLAGGGGAGALLSQAIGGLTQAVAGGKQEGDTSHVTIVAGLAQH